MREAKEIVLVLDTDNTIVEANDFALEAYGYSRGELIGRTVDVFRVPQAEVSVAERTRQLEEKGGHLTFASRHRRSDGVEFPAEVSLSILTIEDETYYLEIVRDVGERAAAERVRGEAALRDSEARYRELFENSLSGFALHEVVLDEDGEPADYVFLAANPAFEEQSGLKVADVLGARATDVVPGLRETGLIERYGRVAQTGEPERFETHFDALGRYFDIQVVSPRPGQFATIFIDITQRRQAEADVARFSQRFEATVMASPLAIVALDGRRRVQLWNPAASAVFGWSAEEAIGEPARFIPPESMEQAEALADALQRRLVGGEQFAGLDLPCVRKDGRRIHTSVSLALMRDEDGRAGQRPHDRRRRD